MITRLNKYSSHETRFSCSFVGEEGAAVTAAAYIWHHNVCYIAAVVVAFMWTDERPFNRISFDHSLLSSRRVLIYLYMVNNEHGNVLIEISKERTTYFMRQ